MARRRQDLLEIRFAPVTIEGMKTRTLGTDGLTTSAIGYGAMALVDGMYGHSDDQRGLATLRHAIDAGATLIDTADAYGAGHNEELIARAVDGRRDEVQLATKWGIVLEPGEHAHPVPHHHDQQILVDARPERAREALEASLRRLGVEAIDLWYLHFPDPAVPIEESVAAMAELVAEGKVRHLGVSNVSADQVMAAHQVHPIAAVQAEYSLWTRDRERDLLPVLEELGTGLVAWSPLGAGFFAGSADRIGSPGEDFRTNHPRFKPENLAANRDRYAPLRGLASELGITPAQLALAWMLHQGEHIVPIPSTRTPDHLDENLAAAGVDLDAATLERIDEIAPAGAAAGSPLL
jgi:aryl-alcohol dehydrogenase-like predicted oxidoreductase